MPPPPDRPRPTATVMPPAADLVGRPTPTSWLERWLAACADLQQLVAHHQLLDTVIEEVAGRRIRVNGRWLLDFASCNYLGLDLDPEVIGAIPGYLARWGTHPSWSRMLGSPALYQQIEEHLTALLGAEDALLLPTLTHIHAAVIPILADQGTIFVDARAHKTIWDGGVVARAHGAPPAPLRPPRPPSAPGTAAPTHQAAPSHLHGRRQQHDRQPPRPGGVHGAGA